MSLIKQTDVAKVISMLEERVYTHPSEIQELLEQVLAYQETGLNASLLARRWMLKGIHDRNQQKYAEAEKSYIKGLKLAESNGLEPLKVEILLDLAGIAINTHEFQKAETYLNRSKKTLEPLQDFNLDARYLLRLGFLMIYFGKFDEALLHLLAAEQKLTQLPEVEHVPAKARHFHLLAQIYSGLGEIYSKLGDKPKSIAAYLHCLDICKTNNIRLHLAWYYLYAGNSYLADSHLEKAEKYFKLALKEAQHSKLSSSASANLGIIAIKQGKYKEATKLFESAEMLCGEPETPEDYANISIIQAWRAQIYLHTQLPNFASICFQNAYQNGKKGNNHNHVISLCRTIADFFAGYGEFEKAYTYQKLADEHNTTYNRQLQEEKIREIQIRHDAERREKEAILARSQLTALQLRVLRAQFNPHFLFNALNAIQGFVTSHKNDEAEVYIARFGRLMRTALELSELEWIPLDKEVDFIRQFLDINAALRFDGNLHWTISIDPTLDQEEYYIPSMVLQPFVENAIEHGLRPLGGGKLSISFRYLNDQQIQCLIEDDGIGINKSRALKEKQSAEETHQSKGMQFTLERLQLLHQGEMRKDHILQLTDNEETGYGAQKGTLVELIIPILNEDLTIT